ncbi:AraC family transcriptional regulator [Sporofaciens musculi]|jgi:AraC-type DNA-binding domain-containing proteins|uniref:AraC family transcriptional regulator n=2 Tax=Sporofaciens musculi TaxID=2681861 RepID=UPI00216C78C9|nr:AraC family transcriptional regulator [Sporofaciens musculi]MCI9423042.1 AraC family transcriptional regulator [Dorea sp.]
MNQILLDSLRKITEEENAILHGSSSVQKKLYTSKKEFVIDNAKLLERGHLIELRPHTRFVHFPRHRHNYVEMVYMCSGTTTHIINDTDRIKLNAGDLLFLNQNATQEIFPAKEEDIAVNFIILPEFFDCALTMIERDNVLRNFLISTLSEDTSQISYLHFETKEILPIQNLIENMLWTLIDKKPNMNTINQITMGLVFMNLSAFGESIMKKHPGSYEQDLIFRILKYIETHYKSGTLADISTEIKLPNYQVSRLLKKYTGHTFKELLQQQKLQQAVYLLSQTNLSIDAVIGAVGYNNSSFFYRIFREKYGYSPGEYRKL